MKQQIHSINVLVLGSGGREHALCWAIANSNLLKKLYCSPGNAGTSDIAKNINLEIEQHQTVINFCKENKIDLVVIGAEAPLVDGLADSLNAANILTFGPSSAAAKLEGSKGFTKDICRKYNIPTADYERFDNFMDAKDYIKQQNFPIVIKADGLAAGKGVIIAENEEKAFIALGDIFSGKFGNAAGREVVIEDFLEGEEASFFVLISGKQIIPLATAQDHKRAYDNDEGPNTGGMGAYSPAPLMTDDLCWQVIEEIITPTIKALKDNNTSYSGILYAGLMITKDGPKLIEYNVRFGDPECQVLMMRLKSDLLKIMLDTARGDLKNTEIKWNDNIALTIVMAANGYPEAYKKGSIIRNIDINNPGIKIFHAGTKKEGEQIVSNGGRVLNITALGTDVKEARQKAYEVINSINWPEGFYRKDIGMKAIKLNNE